jgi:SAM-dependent methyltransferase
MTVMYDEIGKLDLSNIYNESDPVRYFSVLGQLDYRIPDLVKPVFEQVIAARRELSGDRSLKVVDIGCSYGVNAALLKYDLSMDDLDAHYAASSAQTRDELLREDAAFFAEPRDPDLELIGLDTAERALSYAVDAGLLDGAVATNLEVEMPSDRDAALLSKADLVISTGCFGYVSERTFESVLDLSEETMPWMAHSVLRMFDFESAERSLAERGYVTEKLDALVRQRQFATETERDNVIETLVARGVDPSGHEDQGTYFAEIFVSRPVEHAMALPLEAVFSGP